MLKERNTQQRAHSQLVHDQVALQSLHEQLTSEYENLIKERDAIRANLRDAKNEMRIMREAIEKLEAKNKTLLTEKENSASNAKSLNNLRGEHSKLKVSCNQIL